MIYLIDPMDLKGKPCAVFCKTFCSTKCPLDFVEPLYGIPT